MADEHRSPPGTSGPSPHLAALTEAHPDPAFALGRDGTILACNPAAEQLARVTGRAQAQHLLPSNIAAIVRSCLASSPARTTVDVAVGERTLRWWLAGSAQDGVVYAFARDVTEAKQLEAELRHSQRFEPMGRLAAGVAHDFNNILTVIQGHVGLLESETGLSSGGRESLQQIARAAERAAQLAGQLMIFSRRNVLQPRSLDLNDVVTGLSAMLQRTLGEDITFQFKYASNLPPIQADRGLIEQVVMNLSINARDNMPNGGQLLLCTSLAEVDEAHAARLSDEARAGRFVCLSLIDTGVGLDSVTLSRLFEPFSTKPKSGAGSGLGLATAYSIVRQHQGWIEVQSQVGQGTTFTVFLPPAPPAAPQPAPPVAEPPLAAGHETILLVEDEPPVRWTIKGILERHHYRVLEAASGVEALAMWHQHHDAVTLLLTDVVMPAGLSGRELAEKFKAQKPSLKIVFVSGYSSHAAGPMVENGEGAAFLRKPFDATSLIQTIQRCLGQEGGAQPLSQPGS